MNVFVGLNKRVLNQVFGVLGIARSMVQELEESVAETGHQLGKGFLAAPL